MTPVHSTPVLGAPASSPDVLGYVEGYTLLLTAAALLLFMVICAVVIVRVVREATRPVPLGVAAADDDYPVCPNCRCHMADVCERGQWDLPEAKTFNPLLGPCPCQAAGFPISRA